MTAPIAIEAVEDAIFDWVTQSTADFSPRVYHVEPEASGQPRPAAPAVQIRQLAPPTPVFQRAIVKIPSNVQQRYTVTAAGPGTVGVDFYLGQTLTAQPITAAIGAITPDAAAVILLAELVANLPAGVTAIADPEDTASVIVDGSTAEPLFAASAVGLTSVTTTRQRYPELEAEWWRLTWRLSFYGEPTRGFGTASDMLGRSKKAMARIFTPLIHAAGWRPAGILAATDNLPTDRSESLALLDFALEGYATAIYQLPAARAIGLDTQITT